ncbi:MAG: ROK family protein [Chloroflexi bacterium]|nr:ROK family protein [Chloroflexota bacterium]
MLDKIATEQLFGAGHNRSDFVVVTIGRGIGMGMVVNGQVYESAHGGAGELGHHIILTGAGTPQALEDLAADPAVVAGVTDYDVIGVSYYPQWSTFSIAEVGAQVGHLRQRFGKDVMVLETAYGWTRDAVDEMANNVLSQSIPGYPFSPDGQRRFLIDLMQALISNGALGAVYWEPAWVSTGCSTRWGQGAHWDNATLFDFTGDLLEGAAYLSHEYR